MRASTPTTARFAVEGNWVAIAGPADRNLKLLREALGIGIAARDGAILLSGDAPQLETAQAVLSAIAQSVSSSRSLDRKEVLELITRASAGTLDPGDQSAADEPEPRARQALRGGPVTWQGDLEVYDAGRKIRARSDNQRYYLDAIRTHDLVFGVGPAGTGKTYLAVAAAVHMLRSDLVRKMVLVRPAVEAGEKLGFLPGDLEAKVNPYLRPLLDALHDMVDFGTLRRFMESDVLEIAPLAYMRGRTLNHSIVILDEAQNTTVAQMKMFLTRMGHGSKMIVTGDPSQIDLPDADQSGLVDAARRFRRVPGVGFVALERTDVVRHPLVQRVIDAYGDEGAR